MAMITIPSVLTIMYVLVGGTEIDIRDQLPEGVEEFDFALTHITEHTTRTQNDAGSDTKILSFDALGSSFHLQLKRLTDENNRDELPVLVIDQNGTNVSFFNFTQMGIEFFYEENVNGVFAVHRRESTAQTFTFEGVMSGIEEDIVIEPVKTGVRQSRSIQGPIKHLVYRRRHMSKGENLKAVHNFSTVMAPSSEDQVRPVNGSINATVEVLAWTDLSYSKTFKPLFPGERDEVAILKYIATVIHAGNMRYHYGIRDDSLNISLVLTGTVICKTVECSRFTYNGHHNRSIDNHRALDDFAATLTETYNNHNLTFKYDYAVAFTRLDLTDATGNPIGVSFTDDICQIEDGKSSSIIEDQGGYSCIGTFVHELAHTMHNIWPEVSPQNGINVDEQQCSDHDGWFRGSQCSASDGYIMAPMSPLTKNGFYFSQCSINSMKENLMKSNASCVLDLPNIKQIYQSLAIDFPGQYYNTSVQCQQLYGTDFCLSIGTTLEDICYKMYCWDPFLPNVCSTKVSAAHGTSCGPKKWCVYGECVFDERAP